MNKELLIEQRIKKGKKVLGFDLGQFVLCNCPELDQYAKTFPNNSLCIVLGVHKKYKNMVNVYNLKQREFQGWYPRNLFAYTPEWKLHEKQDH